MLVLLCLVVLNLITEVKKSIHAWADLMGEGSSMFRSRMLSNYLDENGCGC